jgi:sulfite reductase (ferredoxin)
VQSSAHALAAHLAPRTRAYHEIWLDGEPLDLADAPDEQEPIYGKTYLPRKFKSGIAYPGDNCVDAYTQDLAFVAELDGTALAGFTVLVGGGMGSTHGKKETYPRLATPLAFVRPGELLEVAEAIVTVYRDHGDRDNRKHARLKYVIEERGIAWFRAEVELRLGRTLEDPHPVHFDEAHDHLGWDQQADGKWCLGIFVESGRVVDRVSSLTRSGIRAVLELFSAGVRLTGQQNLIFVNVDERDCLAIETMLRDHGVETDPGALGLRRHAMACPALQTCGLAVAEAERALPGIVRDIELELANLEIFDATIGIRMTGCPNGCARPRMGDIGIIGRSLDVYDLFIGGDRAGSRLNQLLAQGVRRDALASTLRPVLERWKEQRLPGETLGDYAERVGVDVLQQRNDTEELVAS